MIKTMIRLCALAPILAASLLSTQAAGVLNYKGEVFSLPAGLTQPVLTEDCSVDRTIGQELGQTPLCIMGGQTYTDLDGNLEITVYNARDFLASPPEDGMELWYIANKNFQSLVRMEKNLKDFYDENGFILNPENPLFAVFPGTFRGEDFLIRDVEPITFGDSLAGYVFTPAEFTGDFPHSYSKRTAVIQGGTTGLVFVIQLGYDGESMMRFQELFGEIARRGSDENSWYDTEYYTENPAAYAQDLNDAFDAAVSEEVTSAQSDTIWSIVGSLFGDPVATAFPDVAATHPLINALTYLKDTGVIQGYSDGTMKPDQPINRAEFMKILMEATAGKESMAFADDCFSDVKASDWYSPYVCFAKEGGIVSGYPDGTFGGSRNINLAEALKITFGAYRLSTDERGGEWYTKYVGTAEEYGFLKRIKKAPGDLITRAEMAEIVTKALFLR